MAYHVWGRLTKTLVKHSEFDVVVHGTLVLIFPESLKNTIDYATLCFVTTSSRTHNSIHVSAIILLLEHMCAPPWSGMASPFVTDNMFKHL